MKKIIPILGLAALLGASCSQRSFNGDVSKEPIVTRICDPHGIFYAYDFDATNGNGPEIVIDVDASAAYVNPLVMGTEAARSICDPIEDKVYSVRPRHLQFLGDYMQELIEHKKPTTTETARFEDVLDFYPAIQSSINR